MAQPDNISKFYKVFSEEYNDFKDEADFRDWLSNADDEKMNKLFDVFSSTFNDFSDVADMREYLGYSSKPIVTSKGYNVSGDVAASGKIQKADVPTGPLANAEPYNPIPYTSRETAVYTKKNPSQSPKQPATTAQQPSGNGGVAKASTPAVMSHIPTSTADSVALAKQAKQNVQQVRETEGEKAVAEARLATEHPYVYAGDRSVNTKTQFLPGFQYNVSGTRSRIIMDELQDAYSERDRLDEEIRRRSEALNKSNQVSFATGLASSEIGYDYTMSAKADDPELSMLWIAKRQNEERIKTLEKEKNNWGFWKSLGESLFSLNTLDFGLMGMKDMTTMLDYKDAKLSGDVAKARDAMMRNAYESGKTKSEYGDNDTFLQRAGELTANAIPFIVEFNISGGFGAISKYGTRMGAKAAVAMSLNDGANAAKRTAYYVVKNTGTLAGDMAAGFVMANTTGSAKTMQDVLKRHYGQVVKDEEGNYVFSGGKNWAESIYEGEMASTLEYFTEKLGGHLGFIGDAVDGGLKKMGAGRVSELFNRIKGSEWNKWLSKGGVNELPGEAIEEEANIILNSLLVGDNRLSDLFDPKTQADIWGGMMLSIGFMKAPSVVGSVYDQVQYQRYKHDTDKADATAAASLTAEKWEPIRSSIDETTNDKMGDVIDGIISDRSLNNRQKVNVIEYVKSLMKMRGFNMRTIADAKDMVDEVENGEETEEMRQQREEEGYKTLVYNSGYYADEQERKDIATRLKINADDEEAKMMWEGLKNRILDEAENEVSAYRAYLYNAKHNDGRIVSVGIKTDEETIYYLIEGNVVVDGGQISKEKSDPTVTIKNSNTGEVLMVDPSSSTGISEVFGELTSEDVESMVEQRRSTLYNNAMNEIQGNVVLEPGDRYPLPEGGEATILSVDGDDVVFLMPDGTQNSAKISDLQRMADEESINDYNMRNPSVETADVVEQTDRGEENPADGNTLPEGYVEGVPEAIEIGTEVVFADDFGDMHNGIFMGMVDPKNGEFVPSENGRYAEIVADGITYHVKSDEVAERIVAHVPNRAETPAEEKTEPRAENDATITSPQDSVASAEPMAEDVPSGKAEVTVDNQGEPIDKDAGTDKINNEKSSAETEYEAAVNRYGEKSARKIKATFDDRAADLDKKKKALDKAQNAFDDAPIGKEEKAEKALAKAKQEYDVSKADYDHWAEVKSLSDAAAREERARLDAIDAQRHAEAVEAEQQRQAEELAKRAEQEERGANAVHPAIREKWEGSKKVEGMENEIVLPNGERVEGRYMLVESGAVTPSHDARNGFSKSEGFPVDENGNTVNDRDYERDADAQRVTRDMASKYDGRALQSVPVVSKDGVVLSGNGRTMAGDIAAEEGTDAGYIETLKKYPQQFGFTSEQVEGMEHPRVVFVAKEDMPYTAETFAKFNQQDMKSQSRTEQSVKMGKLVDDNAFGRIVRRINGFDTLGDFYNDEKACAEALQELYKAGAINDMQLAEMRDGDKLSAVGRQMLENMLVGKAFDGNPDAIRMLSEYPSMRQRVITALGEIVNNKKLGEDYSLEKELAESISLAYQARKSGVKEGEPVSAFALQTNIFTFDDGETVADYENATMLMLADLLNGREKNKLKNTIALYNDAAKDAAAGQMDMFSGDVRSKEEILKDILNTLNYGNRKDIESRLNEAAEQRKQRAAGEEAAGGVQQDDAAKDGDGAGRDSGSSTERTEKGALWQKVEGSTKEVSAEQRMMTEALVNLLNGGGMDASVDIEEGQRILDEVNGRVQMNAADSKRRKERDAQRNTIAEAISIVTGKPVAEARKELIEAERERREEAKEVYKIILSGEYNDVSLQKIQDFIDHATPNNKYGRRVSERLPQRVERKMLENKRGDEVEALVSRVSESSIPANERAREATRGGIAEAKKSLLEKWAKAAGKWHTELSDFTNETEPIGHGNDSDVYPAKDGEHVIKLSRGKNDKRFKSDPDAVTLFNYVFPNSAYRVLGYGDFGKGFVRILEQPIVDFANSTPLTVEERVEYMEKLGFKPINKECTAFSNGELLVADLQKSNIVRDYKGDIRVIDADVKLHTKDAGGNYTYLPVEHDLPQGEGLQQMKAWHGSAAVFDAFDSSHFLEGEGSMVYGAGHYVTDVEETGRMYANVARVNNRKVGRTPMERAVNSIMGQYVYNSQSDSFEKAKEVAIRNAKSEIERNNGMLDGTVDVGTPIEGETKRFVEESLKNAEEELAVLNGLTEDVFLSEGEKSGLLRQLYEVEIPDDNGNNYLDWNEKLSAEKKEQLRPLLIDASKRAKLPSEKIESIVDADLAGDITLEQFMQKAGKRKETSDTLSDLGYVGIKVPTGNMNGGDGRGMNYVIFKDSDLKIKNRISFHKADESAPVFYSNAYRAVEGIKQEKATPEQWLKMLEKNGGLKAGEDKWIGLSEWLKDAQRRNAENGGKATLTKDEVLDYIAQNKIEIEEVGYSETSNSFEELKNRYESMLREEGFDAAQNYLSERYGDDASIAFEDLGGELTIANAEAASILLNTERAINSTRLDYTTEGLENKKEIALVVPTVEPYNESDEIHFGDADNGRAVAWVRFGDATDADGKRVLVIDEIQSKRHQDGREKGYKQRIPASDEAENNLRNASQKLKEYIDAMRDKYDARSIGVFRKMTLEENYQYQILKKAKDKAQHQVYVEERYIGVAPDAPFEKNWHELAMKRMLRYAAENGYDKVAWTTGAQQAERYDIGSIVERISVDIYDGERAISPVLRNGQSNGVFVDNNGVITKAPSSGFLRDTKGKNISEVFGKELSEKLMSAEDGTEFEGNDIMIGGEGMKGFYDQMLPKFMDKYGKKWGVKTGEVELDLPNEADRVMHSVDVTPEMKESVMEGQPMFFKTEDGEVYGFVLDGKIYIDPRIATAETPIHEYTHLWTAALRKANPKAWEQMKKVMRKEADLMEYVKKKYPELANNEDALMDEVFAHYSGKRGKERLDAEMKAEMEKAEGAFEKSKIAAIFGKIKAALDMFWNMARDLFAGSVKGLSKMKAEDFADMAMNDLLNGFNPKKNNGVPASEQKTMMGTHNISEEKLRKALKNGGFANPSVAIVDTRKGINEGYGDITLLPTSSLTLEKQRGRNAGTWMADAWTPTYPNVSVLPGKNTEKAEKEILAEWTASEPNEAIRKELERKLRYFVSSDDRGHNEHLQYQFLKEKGMQPEVYEKTNDYDKDFYAFLQNLSEETGVPITELMHSEHGDQVGEWYGKNEAAKVLEKSGSDITDEMKSEIEQDFIDKWKTNIGALDNIIYGIYRKAQRPSSETDVYKTFSNAEMTVVRDENLRKEYEQWLSALDERLGMEEKLFAGFTPSGNRRYVANTLENASKLMNKGGQAGNFGWGGDGPFIAKIAEQANTLDKMRKNRGKLIGRDQAFLQEEARQHIRDEFFDLSQVLNKGYGRFDSVGDARMEEIAGMKGDIRGYLKREYGVEVSDEWMQRYNDLVNFIRNEYPVFYFETKFNRPVELWEFSNAIVPEGTSEDVVEGLKKAGVQVTFYDKNVEGDRERVTNEVADNAYGVKFHKADDADLAKPEVREVVDELKDGKTVKAYRAMQMVDGKLYPPMAAVVEGEYVEPTEPGDLHIADERPDLVKDGKFKLNKGNGSSIGAAYNPYFHTSLSPLNDQFSSAWNRPNLVTVEVEIPESELTSGYKAEGAKDAVGETEWKSGPVSGKLAKAGNPRRVILSRYCKVNRVLDDAEVAERIADMLAESGVDGIPFNTVTPSLRDALVNAGVKITEPQKDNAGDAARGAYEEWKRTADERAAGATDRQGNPIDNDGKLIVEKVDSISDLTDEDFTRPTRSVQLPELPKVVDETIGANGKPVVIKKNIFKKNLRDHSDVTPENSRDILISALYNADLYGQNQMMSKPYNWIVVNVKESGKNKLVLLEVSDKKDNVEIVHWHYLRDSALETIKRQAEREGGRILILPSLDEEAGGLSSLTNDLSSSGKITNISETDQKNVAESADTMEQKRDAVRDMGEQLNTNVRIITDAKELEGATERQKSAKGWYNLSTGSVVIVLPNCTSVDDAKATMFHEVVAHKGLRELVGDGKYDVFCMDVYEHADEEVRRKIADKASANGWDFAKATDEYLGELAEKGFEDFDSADRSIWNKIKDFVLELLDKMLEGIRLPKHVKLGDNELRYMLWRSRENLKRGKDSLVDVARDVVKRDELGLIDGDMVFRDGDDTTDRVAARESYERMLNSSRYQFTEAMQDSMASLKKLYEAVKGKGTRIEDIPDMENAYLAENRMSSMNASQIKVWNDYFMKPIIEEVHKLAGNDRDAYDTLIDYMMAKHGLERNKVMAERDANAKYEEEVANGGTPDLNALVDEYRERDYAGLTALTGEEDVVDAEGVARTMVDDYEADHDTQPLWAAIGRATRESLKKSLASGMMSYERYNKILNMFQYYIPLQGFDEKVAEEVYTYLGSDGTLGYGTPIRAAKGRKSKADDPIATIQMNGEASIRQGNRNVMKQRFLNFVQNNPSDLVGVQDVWLRKNDVTGEWEQYFDAGINDSDSPAEVERKTNEFTERMEQLSKSDPDHYKRSTEIPDVPYRVVESRDMKQHQVTVKVNGRSYMLTINGNPRAAQALNGLTNPNVQTEGSFGKILNFGERINRYLAPIYTTLNPEFMLSNYLRDAIYSNSMTWVKEDKNYALKFNKNFVKFNPIGMGKLYRAWENGSIKAFAESPSALGSNLSKEEQIKKYFYEFMMNGGETGWTNLRDIEKHKKEIEKMLKAEGNVTKRAVKATGAAYDLANKSVENCARFAAYVTSREMGRNVARSIWDSKEVSVNFNKKGAGDKFMDAKNQTFIGKTSSFVSGYGRGALLFWNASVQGLNNVLGAAKKHYGKFAGLIGSLFAMGAIQPILAQLIGGDDDDEYYDIPEYKRRSNIIFRFGKDMPWVTIPLPLEFRSIFGLGELFCGVMTGKERYSDKELAHNIASQLSQVMPVDFLEGGGGLHAIEPTFVKPILEVNRNVGWSGLPIHRDNTFREHDPEWTLAYSNTNKTILEATKFLNEKTGGSDVTKGLIDLNPADIEYLANGYGGGIFSMANKVQKLGETILGEREFEWRNVPIASRVLYEGDERTAQRKINNQYFNLIEEYEKTKHDYKKLNEEAESGREDFFKYAERVSKLEYSKEYGHYLIVDTYKEMIDNVRDLQKNGKGFDKDKLKAYEDMLKRECVEFINQYDEGEKEVPTKEEEATIKQEYGKSLSELRNTNQNK